MSPFALPGLGFNSSVLMKHEATYGTAASGAAEHASELVSATITPRLSSIIDPSLTNTQRSARFIGQGGQYYEWTVKVRVGYNGLLPWLRMMLPSYSHALVDTTAHNHTFKEVGVLSPGSSYGEAQWAYTIDISWGGVPTSAVTRLIGALATGLRITGQAGTGDNAMLMCEVSGTAKSVTPNLSAGLLTTVALPTALGVIFHQQLRTTGNFGVGTGTVADSIQLKSFEVNIQQPFDTQRFLFGQLNAESPVPNGIMTCVYNFDLEWASAAEMISALAGGGATVKLFFQHPTTIGAVSAKSELEIRSLSPTSAEYSTAIEGYGVVTQRHSLSAAYNVSDASAVVIRAQNTDAAMTF
jgi:hypothetical protein